MDGGAICARPSGLIRLSKSDERYGVECLMSGMHKVKLSNELSLFNIHNFIIDDIAMLNRGFKVVP